MSGGAWLAGDVATKDRMNRKGWLCDTGAGIAAFASPQEGMHAYCTGTGSGFYKGREYVYDGAGWRLAERNAGALLIREVGRGTLSVAGDSLTVGSIPPCENITLLVRKEASSGVADVRLQFNGDSGSNYAHRQSGDGSADSTTTGTSQIAITVNNGTLPSFSVIEISNRANEEKMVTALDVTQNTAGAATAPGRGQVVGKWANISARISSITLTNGAAGDYAAGTEVVVLAESADEGYQEFWQELGSATLGSAGDDLDVTSFAARKYLMIEAHLIASGNIGGLMTFNNDGGTSYAQRSSANGAADVTSASRTTLALVATAATSDDVFVLLYVINIAEKEKLVLMWSFRRNNLGDAAAPTKLELVGKWINTSGQITRVDINNNGAGSFDTGSIMKIWGSD